MMIEKKDEQNYQKLDHNIRIFHIKIKDILDILENLLNSKANLIANIKKIEKKIELTEKILNFIQEKNQTKKFLEKNEIFKFSNAFNEILRYLNYLINTSEKCLLIISKLLKLEKKKNMKKYVNDENYDLLIELYNFFEKNVSYLDRIYQNQKISRQNHFQNLQTAFVYLKSLKSNKILLIQQDFNQILQIFSIDFGEISKNLELIYEKFHIKIKFFEEAFEITKEIVCIKVKFI